MLKLAVLLVFCATVFGNVDRAAPCYLVYMPLCGSDGKTYTNDCFFKNAQRVSNGLLTVAYKGECRKPVELSTNICYLVYFPVCGSDGKTYSNDCFFKLAQKQTEGLTMASQGECPKLAARSICTEPCPKEYRPVCSNEGVTYSNLCFLQKAACENPKVTLVHRGPCAVEELCYKGCPRIYMPVCGTDGKTYGNDCELQNAQCLDRTLATAYSGACGQPEKRDSDCLKACTREYSPVCGSNGRTYSNPCQLHNAQCVRKQLSMVYRGECKAKTAEKSGDCLTPCTRIYDPVCGNNGRTYANPCELHNSQCTLKSLTMAYRGECSEHTKREDCMKACTRHYEPVCASNGRTYPNECELHNAQCTRKSLTMVYGGECSEQADESCINACTRHYDPVCGSNGRTYPNPCELHNAQCLLKSINMAYRGECSSQQKREDCMKACTRHYDPVCASNGRTYANPCELGNAHCLDTTVVRVYGGMCRTEEKKCDRMCPMHYDPVCGSDGKTYGNLCMLETATCLNAEVQLAYRGEC